MLKWNKACSSKSNTCLLKKGNMLGKPYFIGTQKSHNVNIKSKVQETK